jgi:hypothetical protein
MRKLLVRLRLAPPTKNAVLYDRLLRWIDESRDGGQPTDPRLRDVRWSQAHWFADRGPGRRTACIGAAAVLAAGYQVTIRRGWITIVRPWWRPGWAPVTAVARRTLGITRYEAGLLFSPKVTRAALEAARACFEDNKPITYPVLALAEFRARLAARPDCLILT